MNGQMNDENPFAVLAEDVSAHVAVIVAMAVTVAHDADGIRAALSMHQFITRGDPVCTHMHGPVMRNWVSDQGTISRMEELSRLARAYLDGHELSQLTCLFCGRPHRTFAQQRMLRLVPKPLARCRHENGNGERR